MKTYLCIPIQWSNRIHCYQSHDYLVGGRWWRHKDQLCHLGSPTSEEPGHSPHCPRKHNLDAANSQVHTMNEASSWRQNSKILVPQWWPQPWFFHFHHLQSGWKLPLWHTKDSPPCEWHAVPIKYCKSGRIYLSVRCLRYSMDTVSSRESPFLVDEGCSTDKDIWGAMVHHESYNPWPFPTCRWLTFYDVVYWISTDLSSSLQGITHWNS